MLLIRLRQLVRLSALVLLVASPAAADSPYGVMTLDPPTPAFWQLESVSDTNVAVGRAGTVAIAWTTGGATPLISNPADAAKFPAEGPLRINILGTVAGMGCPSGCPGPLAPAIWSLPFGLVFLPATASPSTITAINNNGVVAGTIASGGGVLWLTGATTPTVIPDTRDAVDVNDSQQVVGSCVGGACGPAASAYVWTQATGRVVLPKVGGTISAEYHPTAINNAGHVVGWYADAGGTPHVFFWSTATGTVSLASPLGAGEIVTLDINDKDLIVTTQLDASNVPEPFLFRRGVWINLNTFVVPEAHVTLGRVNAINNNGWMVGQSANGAGATSSSTWALIAPFVDINANGSGRPATFHPGDSMQIQLTLTSFGSLQGELYLGVVTPGGVAWFTRSGIAATPSPIVSGSLPLTFPTVVFNFPNVSALPPGTYAWIVAFDADNDGVLEGDFYDAVLTTIVS